MAQSGSTIKNAGIYALGLVLSKLVGLVMLPIYTRYLSPADYARIELLLLTTELTALVIGFGIRQSITRFYYRYTETDDRRTFLSTAIILSIGLYTTASIVGFFNAERLSVLIFEGLPKETYSFKLVFLLFFLEPLKIIPLVLIRAQQRAKLFVMVSLAELLLQVGLNVYFIIFAGQGYVGILYSSIISISLISLYLTIYYFRFSRFRFSSSMAREVLKYGAPIVLLNLGNFVLTFSDRYFLKAYAGLTEVGIYSLGYKLAFIYSTLSYLPLFSSWNPKRYELAEDPTFPETNKTVFTNASLLFIFFALGISVFSRDFFRIIAAPEFHPAYKVVPIILLAYVIQGWTSLTDFGIHYTGKTKCLALVGVVSSAAIVALSFGLIPTLLGYGAALATVAAFLVRFIMTYHYAQKYLHLPYEWGKVMTMLGLAVVVYGLSWLVTLDNVILSVGYNSLLCTAYLGLIWYSPIYGNEEKSALIRTVRQQLQRFRRQKA
ncbi:MAG: hypothetical protein CL942_06800 [Desulfovibrio sp.]|nr:hypothetical protein [Desulfovibrio sp.]|tara:strand:+ start:3202 stop:4677 length:1476 start_codon:yes stop_codon:yes gene_type:complete